DVLVPGGATAVGTAGADARTADGRTVDGIDGVDRFDAADRVAQRLPGQDAYVVEGVDPDPRRGWPDALAVGPLAALGGQPILLVDTDLVPTATAPALEGRGAAATRTE